MRTAAFLLVSALFSAAACGNSPAPAPVQPGVSGGGSAAVAGSTTQAGAQAGAAPQAGAPPAAGGSSSAGSGASGAPGGLGGMPTTAGAAGAGNAGGSVPGPPFGHPDAAVTHPQYDGFTLWVVEDFTEALDLDADPIWTWSDGGFETHRFRKEAISFTAGKMVLTLSNDPQPASCSFSNTGNIPQERPRSSGELRSKHNWFRYGRYETRLKVPSVKPGDAVTNGNYITSLFTYRQPACQEWREIDLEVTGDSAFHLGTNLITADQDCNFSDDKQQIQYFDLPGNFRTDFQTIGFEWLPTSIEFYYLGADGKPVSLRKLTGPKVPQLSAKIMANLWVFNDSYAFGGPLGANNVYPLKAEYDFIRFYKWNQDTQYPCSDMSTACLAATDLDLTANNACDGVPRTGDVSTCQQCGSTLRLACPDACQ